MGIHGGMARMSRGVSRCVKSIASVVLTIPYGARTVMKGCKHGRPNVPPLREAIRGGLAVLAPLWSIRKGIPPRLRPGSATEGDP